MYFCVVACAYTPVPSFGSRPLCRSLTVSRQKPNKLPIFATHQVGVAGFVLNEAKGEVLTVRDESVFLGWKLPGTWLNSNIHVT